MTILGKHWLTSDHMTNVNNLMLHAGYSLSGFQGTMLAPVLKKDGMWHIPADGFKSQRSPSTNIHYNSQKHWVTSFQFEDGEIYLLDGDLTKDIDFCFNDSLKIQLAQIYGYQKSKVRINIPYIQQQNSGHDCGLFAIANMMEFVASRYSGLKEGKLQFELIQS